MGMDEAGQGENRRQGQMGIRSRCSIGRGKEIGVVSAEIDVVGKTWAKWCQCSGVRGHKRGLAGLKSVSQFLYSLTHPPNSEVDRTTAGKPPITGQQHWPRVGRGGAGGPVGGRGGRPRPTGPRDERGESQSWLGQPCVAERRSAQLCQVFNRHQVFHVQAISQQYLAENPVLGIKLPHERSHDQSFPGLRFSV